MQRKLNFAALSLLVMLFAACAATEQKASSATTASPAATATPMTTAELEKFIIELEKKSWEPSKTHSPEAAKRLNAPGFRAIYFGTIKSEEEAANDTKEIEIKSLSFSDWKVSFPIKDAAIVTYKYNAVSTYEGKPAGGAAIATSTWVNIGGEWKLAIYAETKAATETKK